MVPANDGFQTASYSFQGVFRESELIGKMVRLVLRFRKGEPGATLPKLGKPPARSVEMETAWIREEDRRMATFRDGRIEAVAGPQTMAELRKGIANELQRRFAIVGG